MRESEVDVGGGTERDGTRRAFGSRPYDAARILVGTLRADRVTAEITQAGASADDPYVASDVLVRIAAELTGLGAALTLADRRSFRTIETSLRQYRASRATTLHAAAARVQRDEIILVWQVAMTDDRDAEPFAVVTQTQVIAAGAAEAAWPATAVGEGARAGLDHDATAAGPAQSPPQTPRRERIAAAAAGVIAKKGFFGASIREIADAAGMHVPTLYQHVASKDEVLELVYDWTMTALRTDLDAEVAAYPTAEQKLRAAIGILVHRGDRSRQQVGLLNRELKSLSPGARARVLDQYRDLLGRLERIVIEGIAAQEFRSVEPEIVANLIDAACDVWPLRQFTVGRFGVEAFGRQVAEMILGGLMRADPAGRSGGG